jgi:hypothetical protein
MIAEVHQEDLCKPTHIIIPQAEEAERMVGMMNKNLMAFLYYMLLEMDFTEEIVKLLIKKSCEASLVRAVPMCKWDSKTRTLTTPEDEKHEREIKAFEGAAWFKDEFGFLKRELSPSLARPPEELFNLDSSSSIKTITIVTKHQAYSKSLPAPQQKGTRARLISPRKAMGTSHPKPLLLPHPWTRTTMRPMTGRAPKPPPKTWRKRVRPMVDSPYQLPFLIHGRGTAHSV